MELGLKILLKLSIFLTTIFIVSNAYSEEFGLVERKGEDVYLHSSESSLETSSAVHLLGLDIVLRIHKRMEKNLKQASHVLIHSQSSTVYLLLGEKKLELNIRPTAAVILPVGKNEKLKINYRYFSCTSNEGVHHSVYSVDKDGEKRLWSAYQYLPYDVEPSCTKNEYAE